MRARPATLIAGMTILPVRLEFTTGRRALFVDRAVHGLTDRSLQCRTAYRRTAIRATHGKAMRIDPQGKFDGDSTAQKRLGFGPMEGHAVTRTTGAAMNTGGHSASEEARDAQFYDQMCTAGKRRPGPRCSGYGMCPSTTDRLSACNHPVDSWRVWRSF